MKYKQILLVTLFLSTAQVTFAQNLYKCPKVLNTFSVGSRDYFTDKQVSQLQTFLKSDLSLLDSEFIVTGYFGKVTKNFVTKFQLKNNLIPTGTVNLATSKKISEICNLPKSISISSISKINIQPYNTTSPNVSKQTSANTTRIMSSNLTMPVNEINISNQGQITLANLRNAIVDKRVSVGTSKIKVNIDSGINRLTYPLILDDQLCGEGLEIVGKQDLSSSISGAVKIPNINWNKVLNTNVYEVDLSDFMSINNLNNISNLYTEKKSLEEARYPNLNISPSSSSTPEIENWWNSSPQYPYEGMTLKNTANMPIPYGDFEVVIPMGWSISHLRGIGIGKNGDQTYISVNSAEGKIEKEKSIIPATIENAIGPFHAGTQKVYLKGNKAFIDMPGEWSFDKNSKILSYYPIDDLQSLEDLYIPTLENLIKIDNCSNLKLNNLNISHTNFLHPKIGGYIGVAGDRYYEWLNEGQTGFKFTDQPAAINIYNSTNLIIDKVRISNIGGMGIKITDSTFSIVNSFFTNIAGNGLKIVSTDDSIKRLGIVKNNIYKNIGFMYAGDALSTLKVNGVNISNNLFKNIAGRAAFFYATPFTDGNIKQGSNIFALNRIDSVVTSVTDAGAINNGGASGYYIMNNWISNILDSKWNVLGGYPSAIYLDIGSYGIAVNENIIDNVPVGFNLNCQGGNYLMDNSLNSVLSNSKLSFAFCNPFKNSMSAKSSLYLSGLQYNAGCEYTSDPKTSWDSCSCNLTSSCKVSPHTQIQDVFTGNQSVLRLRNGGTGPANDLAQDLE